LNCIVIIRTVIAGIGKSVAIGIFLSGIGIIGAIITEITYSVIISISLIGVGQTGAVVKLIAYQIIVKVISATERLRFAVYPEERIAGRCDPVGIRAIPFTTYIIKNIAGIGGEVEIKNIRGIFSGQ